MLIVDKEIRIEELNEITTETRLNKASERDRITFEFYLYAPNNFL